MEYKRVKIKPWPVALNTQENARILGPKEGTINKNLILFNDNLRAHKNIGGFNFYSMNYLDVINGAPYLTTSGTNGLLLFAYRANDAILGYIEEEDMDITVVKEGLTKFLFPTFVTYGYKLYVLVNSIYEFNPNTKTFITTSLPAASAGCVLRNRFWIADRGYLRYTEPNGLSFPPLNFLPIGNTDEEIRYLSACDDQIFIGKNKEIWIAIYDSTIDNLRLRKLTNRAGVLSNISARADQKTVYFYNQNGVYIFTPEKVNLSPDNLLEIRPGIYKISRKIENDFKTLHFINADSSSEWKRKGDWTLADFYYYDPKIHTHGGANLYIEIGYGGYAAKQLTKQDGRCWSYLKAKGRYMYLKGDVRLSMGSAVNMMHEIPPTNIADLPGGWKEHTWDFAFTNEYYSSSNIYIWLHIATSNTIGVQEAYFSEVEVNSVAENNICGSGLDDDCFYIFGEDADLNRKNYRFHPQDGWSEYDPSSFHVYNLMSSIKWDPDYSLIGFGRNADTGQGILIKSLIPELTTGAMVLHGKTGNLDFGAPELPKKLRKLFVNYTSVEAWTLKIYDERGLFQTITMPVKTAFGEDEINIQSDRSKFFQFEILANNADLIMTDLDAGIKTFAPNET